MRAFRFDFSLSAAAQKFRSYKTPLTLASLFFGLLSVSLVASAQSIVPNPVTICKGETVTFRLSNVASADATSANWDDNGAGGTFTPATGSSTVYTPKPGQLTGQITISVDTAHVDDATLFFYMEKCPRFGGEFVRGTIGFDQVGAAGTDSTQKFSFDFFISRPIPIPFFSRPNNSNTDRIFGPHFRWWGDVRLGSFPQQVNTDILTFSTNFAGNAGKIPVNQLVQTAEFVTGPEFRISQFNVPRGSLSDDSRQVFALAFFGGYGAIGPFSPGQSATVFQVPATTTQQYLALCQQFPNQFPDPTGASCGGRTATPAGTPAQFVAFVPQTRDRFSKKWMLGTRLYTFYTKASTDGELLHTAPAMVDFSFGQSELVTNGKLSGGMVGHFSAFYPFPMGNRLDPSTVVLYLFGEASPAIYRRTTTPDRGVTAPTNPNNPIFLSPALDTNNTAIPITNPNVLVITVPSNNRDTYRIGVGLDLVSVWKRLVSK